MKITLSPSQLPARLRKTIEKRAAAEGISLEEFTARAIRRDLEHNRVAPKPSKRRSRASTKA